jgi:hypothetical protein
MGGFQNRYNQAVDDKIALRKLCDRAWQLLSTVSRGDWNRQTKDWQVLLQTWYDQYIKQVRK